RPAATCEKLTALVPAPSAEPPVPAGTRVPKVLLQLPGSLVAYRNQPVASPPFGLAEPLRVAELTVTPETDDVVTVGAMALVVKVSAVPATAPTEFSATAQK